MPLRLNRDSDPVLSETYMRRAPGRTYRAGRRLFETAGLGIAGLLLLSSRSLDSSSPQSSTAVEERAICDLMVQWVGAYQQFDATKLAALETPDSVMIDRFGQRHLPSRRSEDDRLWSDAFDTVSRATARPKVTIDCIRFLRPEVAVVQATWRFGEGILLADGARIPPFKQADTHVVVRSQRAWLVAVHNMQVQRP